LLRIVSPGAVYVTLDGLEDEGPISSRLSDPTPKRGGRSKRYYRLEALGERALEESAAAAMRVWEAVDEIWGDIAEGVRRRPKWNPVRQDNRYSYGGRRRTLDRAKVPTCCRCDRRMEFA
jgi:DNA-binding PadR family transcriptional regulator